MTQQTRITRLINTTLESVKNDYDFIQYLIEMFTVDDEGNEHPDLLRIYTHNHRVMVNFRGDANWRNADGQIGRCQKCGEHYIALNSGNGGDIWENEVCRCYECGARFTALFGDSII